MPIGFGKYLERLRGEKGLSYRQLGLLADVDHAYIHRLETGEKAEPSEDVIESLIRALKPGERKARILRFLASHSVGEDLLEEVLGDQSIAIEDFESFAQMRARGLPSGREGVRRVLKQVRALREKMEGG